MECSIGNKSCKQSICTCFKDDHIIKMTHHYNRECIKNKKNENIIKNVNDKSPLELLIELKNINCNGKCSDIELLNKKIFNTLDIRKTIEKTQFKPEVQLNFEWLSNYDINKVLKDLDTLF